MRVLVVDGCRPLAECVAKGLSAQGIAADVAYDGLAAAAKFGVNNYDVVVLDRTPPGLSGDALCREINKGGGLSMVLMLNGAGSPEDRARVLSLGADDCLSKPFHFPELVLRVRALARRRPRLQPGVLRAAGVELDRSGRRAARDGRQLDLSVNEAALLEALMAASPRYLSTKELLEKVWDENADPFTKTVAVTVGRLRRKLGEPQVIETAVGVAYRIGAGGQGPSPVSALHEGAGSSSTRSSLWCGAFEG